MLKLIEPETQTTQAHTTMKVLVTGGTGLIGQLFCKRFHAKHNITVLTRSPDKINTLFGDDVSGVSSIDDIDPNDCFDAIINLAGEPIAEKRWSEEQKHLLITSRIDVTRAMVDLIKRQKQKPKVFISASAVGYYGDQGDKAVDELSDARDEFTHRLCQQWESEAKKAEAYGVRVCLLRIGLVVDGQGGFLKKMLPAFKTGFGGKLGSGQQWMSWIHINDLIGILRFLLDNPNLSGTFNATAPLPVTNQDFTKQLGQTLKRPTFMSVPGFVLKASLGEMSHILLTGQRVIPQRLLEAGFHFKHPRLDEALQHALNGDS